MPTERFLFAGPFNGRQTDRAREELCRRMEAGARDVLYVVPNGTAKRAAIADLVRRRQAVFGVRVVTLRALPAEIERRARVRSPEPAGGLAEELVLERAVRRSAPNSALDAPVSGLAARVASTIADVERAGGTRDALAASLGTPDDGTRLLLDAWAHLESWRGTTVRSSAVACQDAVALLRARGASALGGCALVVLEDLPLHRCIERELVDTLVATFDGAVVATNACAPHLERAPGTRSLAALRAMATWRETPCAPGADPLGGALDRLFVTSAPSANTTPTVRIARLEAAGEAAEVRLAARIVRRHLRAEAHDACRPSDIAIVTHARGRYHALIAEQFAAAGIPVSLPRDRSAADSGIGAVLLELLDLAVTPGRATRERALSIVRAPHLDVDAAAADRLERTVRTRGYLTLEGWDDLALRTLGERATNRITRLKRALAESHVRLQAAASPGEIAAAVRTLARDLRLVGNAYFTRRRATRAAPDDALVRARHEAAVREDNQAWETIEHVLDAVMPTLLRIEPALATARGLALAEGWLALFGRALAAERTGTERPVADAVRVVGTRAGDGQPAKVTIVLGLLERSFPREAKQDPILRDAVRRTLRDAAGIELETVDEIAERERECFMRAVATPSHALYLSCAVADATGTSAARSFFLDDFQRAVGSASPFPVERAGVADVTTTLEDAGTRAELLASVAHDVWQRLPQSGEAASRRSTALVAWNRLVARDANGREVAPIAHGRVASVRPTIDPTLLAAAPHTTLELSASQLRSLAHCTYRHFVEKVIAPSTLDAPAYDALRKGTLIHDAMMAWVQLDGWGRGEDAIAALRAWMSARIAAYPPAVRDSALARFQLDQDRDRVVEFLRGELAAMSGDGVFRPRYNELAFGARSVEQGERDPDSTRDTFDLTVATTLGERTVRFTGSVDRLDTLDVGGHTLGIAIDYKTGKSSERYAKAMLAGDDLQLRLYLLAVQRLWGVVPVGALYVGFGDGVRRGVLRADVADRVGGVDHKGVTLLSPDEWHAFAHVDTVDRIAPLIDRLVRLDIVAQPRDGDCGFCNFGRVCGYDAHRVDHA